MRRGLLVIAVATATLAACSGSSGSGGTGPTPGVNHDVNVAMAGIVPETVTVGPNDTITWHAVDSVHVIKFEVALGKDSTATSRAFAIGDTVSVVITSTATAATVAYSDTVSKKTGVVVVK